MLEADAEDKSSRPRPKIWPRGQLALEDLTSLQHCKEKIKLMQCWGLLRKTLYIYRRKLLFHFYKTLVRSHLEYANSVWNPYRMGLIKDLVVLIWTFSKLVMKLKHLKYKERLERLKLPTLRYRRTRGDMIEVYKILTESYCKSVNLELHKKTQYEAG